MTTRDEFAKAALVACVREFFSSSLKAEERADIGWPWMDYEDMAESCYHIADAMMRARMPKLRAAKSKLVKTGTTRRRR